MKRTLVGVLSAAVVAGAAVATPKPATRGMDITSLSVTARPIAAFDKADASRRRFGKLDWRGGLVLSAPLKAFGGWSGLTVDSTGQGFAAVSDAGTWMTGTLTYHGTVPSGLKEVRIGPLMAKGDKALNRQRERDAEALSLASGSLKDGSVLIAFEQKGRIGKFPIKEGIVSAPTAYLTMPEDFGKRRGLDGFEAVTVLRGGTLKGATVAIAERMKTAAGHHAGWIWSGKAPKAFSLTDIGGFDITDLAALPNGDALVLERRFRWTEGVAMRIRRLPAEELKPGAVARGEVLIEADLGQQIDNMEALAVHSGADGDTVLTLISDDNFNGFLQRTVLLQFALAGSGPKQAASP